MVIKKFLSRIGLFSIPFFVIASAVFIIDPYNYFFSHNFISDEVKFHVINRSAESMPRGNTLWKMIKFKKHPVPNVIIGESRAYDLNVDKIRKITNLAYYNFGVPGGNYNSIIETFWYANEIIKLERVYIQVGFHNYSADCSYNLMSDAQKVCKRPYLFFSRFYFFEESVLDFYYSITKKSLDPEEEKFNLKTWNTILENQGESYLKSMKYPEKYYRELKKISDYCKVNDIELNFIIFPDQQDFHDLILKHSLVDMYNKFKADMKSLGRVYDLDEFYSAISKKRSNYRDIFHLQHYLIDTYVVENVWRKN
ncbi:MAG: hypothetical protein JW973_12910 [Bacteroidales bacterium]|nr:hypothetical protein [Bacteroidales bacterium]